MKLIVALGNPGETYKYTRHNAGFLVLDYLLQDDGFITAVPSHEFKSEMATWGNNGQKVIFMKPQTYMNDSGQAMKVICNFYKLDFAKDLLVVHDEVDLPLGELRLSVNSSAAGHNGVQSIIDNLGTQDFARLRIGVETRTDKSIPPTDAFVLQNFSDEEMKKLQDEVFLKAKAEIEKFIGN